MQKPPSLWKCPRCHRTFANRNQSHTCASLRTIESHFVGKPPEIRALFDAVADAIKQLGPVVILPEKTRIAFHVRMSFAQLTPKKNWIDGHVILARRRENPRFTSIQTFSPKNHLHAFRLTSLADVDDEFRAWLAEAYAVGEQKHLAQPE